MHPSMMVVEGGLPAQPAVANRTSSRARPTPPPGMPGPGGAHPTGERLAESAPEARGAQRQPVAFFFFFFLPDSIRRSPHECDGIHERELVASEDWRALGGALVDALCGMSVHEMGGRGGRGGARFPEILAPLVHDHRVCVW
jgi:hypothetical protein